ncbi:MAG: AAA family ATPase [Deltaproteobacteria bacterium]|nr:AAA family ATPase [Deltaproteobacteria bacterium]
METVTHPAPVIALSTNNPNGQEKSQPKNEQQKKSSYLSKSILSFDDLELLEIPERLSLLPWMPEGGLVMIYGPRGIGKTFFSLTLALSLVKGEKFLKWEPSHSVGVLLVDGEMSLWEVRNRFQSLKQGTFKQPLQILSHEHHFQQVQKDLDFGIQENHKHLMEYLEIFPAIKVVILDNLSSLFPTLREDKRDDWVNHAQPLLLRLRRRGIATVLIHHSGKGGDQRGTSSREDSLDTIIRLEKAGLEETHKGANFILSFTKNRSCFGEDIAPIEATLTPNEEGPPTWSYKPVEEGNEERLINMVRSGIDNVTEAAEAMGLAKGTISKIKKRLQDKCILKPGFKLVLNESSPN